MADDEWREPSDLRPFMEQMQADIAHLAAASGLELHAWQRNVAGSWLFETWWAKRRIVTERPDLTAATLVSTGVDGETVCAYWRLLDGTLYMDTVHAENP